MRDAAQNRSPADAATSGTRTSPGLVLIQAGQTARVRDGTSRIVRAIDHQLLGLERTLGMDGEDALVAGVRARAEVAGEVEQREPLRRRNRADEVLLEVGPELGR